MMIIFKGYGILGSTPPPKIRHRALAVPAALKNQPPFFASIFDGFRTPILAPKMVPKITQNHLKFDAGKTYCFRTSFSCFFHEIGCHFSDEFRDIFKRQFQRKSICAPSEYAVDSNENACFPI